MLTQKLRIHLESNQNQTGVDTEVIRNEHRIDTEMVQIYQIQCHFQPGKLRSRVGPKKDPYWGQLNRMEYLITSGKRWHLWTQYVELTLIITNILPTIQYFWQPIWRHGDVHVFIDLQVIYFRGETDLLQTVKKKNDKWLTGRFKKKKKKKRISTRSFDSFLQVEMRTDRFV